MIERGPRPGLAVGVAFLGSAVASVALWFVYVAGGQPQTEGALLGVALGGIGVGLILWAKRFLPKGHDVEDREPLPSPPAERREASEAFEAGAEIVTRRRALLRLLVAALSAVGVAALFPIRSLGRGPGNELFRTGWRPGARAVTADGAPVKAADVVQGNVLTVFPEGLVGSADSQTLLIGLGPGEYRPLPGRETWAPEGIVAFSKVCTHAGCPVGLYRPDSHLLFCPCHQSVFDVLAGASPIGGPAARPLPQLPITLDANGEVVARSDYEEPIGPGFWGAPG